MIRPVRRDDARQICEIYNHYITDTIITFEETPVSVPEMEQRIGSVTERFPWLVEESEGLIRGYAYAGTWRGRSAFRYTVESAVYIRRESHGGGLGSALYRELIEKLQKAGFKTVIGVLSLPNEASRALHRKLGFTRLARYTSVGYKFDSWIDVESWQLLL